MGLGKIYGFLLSKFISNNLYVDVHYINDIIVLKKKKKGILGCNSFGIFIFFLHRVCYIYL